MRKPERLARFTSLWDQTVGCDLCWTCWWGENAPDDMTLFHAEYCPLYGRRDVARFYLNLSYAEKHYGKRFGIPFNKYQLRERRLAHLEKKRRRARSGK